MTSWTSRRGASSQAGMTLIELLVATSLSLLVLALVVPTFVTSVQAQQKALDRDTATANSNTIAMSLQSSLRNAREGTVVIDSAGQTLQAVVLADSAWVCRKWKLSGAKLSYQASASSSWAVLATSVVGTLTSAAAFSTIGTTGNSVSYGIAVTVGNATVDTNGMVTAQAVDTASAAVTC